MSVNGSFKKTSSPNGHGHVRNESNGGLNGIKYNGNGTNGHGDLTIIPDVESKLLTNGHSNNKKNGGIKIEKFQREADIIYLEEDCLSATARKCRITPKKGLIYLITCGIIIFGLIACILYLLANSNSVSDRNKPFSPKLLGGGGGCNGSLSDAEIAAQLISKGHNMTIELLEKFNSKEDWVFNKDTPQGDKAYVHKKGNVYKVTGTLPMTPEDILKVLYDEFNSCSDWNKDVGVCKVLKKLDKRTEIGFQKTKAVGPVSSRDFIALRHYRTLSSEEFALAYESIEWDEEGIEKDADEPVRGYMGLSGWHLRASDDDFDKTDYQFLVDVNLKMFWVPFWDSLMVNGACDTVKYLRQKLSGEDDEPPVVQVKQPEPEVKHEDQVKEKEKEKDHEKAKENDSEIDALESS